MHRLVGKSRKIYCISSDGYGKFILFVFLSLCFFFGSSQVVIWTRMKDRKKKSPLKLTVTLGQAEYSNSTNLNYGVEKRVVFNMCAGLQICYDVFYTFQGWISELQIVTCGARVCEYVCVCVCVCTSMNIYGSYVSVIFAVFTCQKCHSSCNVSGQHWLRSRHFFFLFPTIVTATYCKLD